MSQEATAQTKDKNDRLQLKHMVEMKNLIHDEKTADGKAMKSIKAMREDFRSMLAYQYVYKSHSFKRYDKSREINRPGNRPLSDKTPTVEREKRPSSQHKPRPLGSLRELERYRNELKFPPIDLDRRGTEDEGRSSKLGFDGDLTGFPKIEEALGVEIRYLRDDDGEESIFSLQTKTDVQHKPPEPKAQTGFDMGQNLLRMKQLEQERYDRERLQTPKSDQPRRWRRVLPKTPPSRSSVGFPTPVKTTIGMKKFVKQEVTEVLNTWDNGNIRRKEAVEKAKAREEPPFQLGERTRSTSDIMNDFRRYQEEKGRARRDRDNDLIIVRQLSPVPREGSPKSQRMTEYSSRISSPYPYHRREGSEKIPSVSRTSSYRELPDGPIELHENALLTAAERIEKEKARVIRKKMAQIRIVDEHKELEDEKDDKSSVSRGHKSMPPLGKARFSKPLVAPADTGKPTDTEAIVRVEEANNQTSSKPPTGRRPVSRGSDRPSRKKKPQKEVFDRAAFAALIQQQRLEAKDQEQIDQHSWYSALTRQNLEARLINKFHHDYDDFSRTSPETKKVLELRAKKKRQKQLEKARIIDAKYSKQQSKETDGRSDGDRPSTRVSFNENVVVYQTT